MDAGPDRSGFDADVATLTRDGIVGRAGAFPPDWVDRLREDMMAAFDEARSRPNGAVGRGPQRWYVELHPQALRGFAELVSHPWIIGMAARVLGPEYEIVEVGFDVPFSGAMNQPWHRDFPSPPETFRGRRITSLAFNITGVDVSPEMGPFEVAPGTQWEDGRDWPHGMFPPRAEWDRYAGRAVRKHPRRGDVSCRSALTLHRGTAHPSEQPRPVLVLGIDAPGAGHAALHDMMVTPDFHAALPEEARRHLRARVVDRLVPVEQKHDIEGLVMGTE